MGGGTALPPGHTRTVAHPQDTDIWFIRKKVSMLWHRHLPVCCPGRQGSGLGSYPVKSCTPCGYIWTKRKEASPACGAPSALPHMAPNRQPRTRASYPGPLNLLLVSKSGA